MRGSNIKKSEFVTIFTLKPDYRIIGYYKISANDLF